MQNDNWDTKHNFIETQNDNKGHIKQPQRDTKTMTEMQNRYKMLQNGHKEMPNNLK